MFSSLCLINCCLSSFSHLVSLIHFINFINFRFLHFIAVITPNTKCDFEVLNL